MIPSSGHESPQSLSLSSVAWCLCGETATVTSACFYFTKKPLTTLAPPEHVEPNIGEILRRWGQFVMVAVLFVFALNLVKIPLTLFAFLGGALAIGGGGGADRSKSGVGAGCMTRPAAGAAGAGFGVDGGRLPGS